MNTLLMKIFFPEKNNYNDFINFLKTNEVKFTEEYEYPEYLFTLETTEDKIDKIKENFGQYIFANEDISLIDVFHNTIIETDITISGAESCTGGLVSKYLTDKPGASKYFKYSVTSYSNESKIRILHVNPDKVEEKGVVSKSIIIGMLDGLEYIYPTNIGYAISGVAGPSGGSDEKPIGTVFIGIMQYGRRDIKKYFFKGDRWEIRRFATWTVLLSILNKVKSDK